MFENRVFGYTDIKNGSHPTPPPKKKKKKKNTLPNKK
jgi:hypothetical protein